MKDPNTLKRYGVWILLVALICCVAVVQLAAKGKSAKQDQASAKPAAQTKDAGYVGSDTCKGCHEQQFKQIEGTQHYKTTFAKGRGEDWHGCESCHGPGAAHVEGGGDKSKIFRFEDASANEISQRCMTCHETNAEHMGFNRSVHAKNGVSCTSCHSPHKAKETQFLLAEKQPNLCFTCHTENKNDFMKPFRHRVLEGLINCSDCHNVHGGSASKQLRTTAQQDAVCFKCHSDKKGPFVFEHEPVKSEGCATCHTPHGSNNPRLLTRSQMNSLCLECHTAIPGGPHPQNTKSANCTVCHYSIHGSNTHEFFFQ